MKKTLIYRILMIVLILGVIYLFGTSCTKEIEEPYQCTMQELIYSSNPSCRFPWETRITFQVMDTQKGVRKLESDNTYNITLGQYEIKKTCNCEKI